MTAHDWFTYGFGIASVALLVGLWVCDWRSGPRVPSDGWGPFGG